jgi:hypothetical protein
MADKKTPSLPDGTDTVIEGAAAEPVNTGAIATDRTGSERGGDTLTIEDTALVTEKETPAPKGDAERTIIGSGSPETGLAERFRSGREKLAGQAGDRARGLVGQGLERRNMATMPDAPPGRSRMSPTPSPRRIRTSCSRTPATSSATAPASRSPEPRWSASLSPVC